MQIIRFKGGLGNQMFQYAFMRMLENKGYKVGASIGYYEEISNIRNFDLIDVFPEIVIDIDKTYDVRFIEKYNAAKQMQKKGIADAMEKVGIIIEDKMYEGCYQADAIRGGENFYVGYWQSYKYFESLQNQISRELLFPENIIDEIKNIIPLGKDSVVVHIRRGDYLNVQEMYGNICTEEYYKGAIKYMREMLGSPRFIYVSDEIDWVEDQEWAIDGIYVKEKMFNGYKYWYDMAIMSLGENCIIANSSFSWWGAWLNRNNGIVIAPRKWNNLLRYEDICPKQWIRM